MMNKKNITKLVFFCVIAVVGWSCKKTSICECFEAAGKPASIIRTIDGFNQIVVNDDINVFISQGAQQVEIQGGENLIENIATNVSGGVLTLQNNNICDWMRSYKKSIINVYITIPNLTSILSNGVGSIQSTDTLRFDTLQIQTKSASDINLLLRSKSVYAHMFGTSDLTLTGSADLFECNFFAGTGFVYCDGFKSGYTFISHNSTGDCYVSPLGELDVIIYKYGNVYYKGSPSPISVKTFSSGQLIKE